MNFIQVPGESGGRICPVYFPIEGVISLVAAVADNANIELGLGGCEGCLALSPGPGVEVVPLRNVD